MKLEIKILGANCSKCNKLFERTQHVVDKYNVDAKVVKVDQVEELKQCNIFVIPALLINNDVVSRGQLLNESAIISLLNKYLPLNEQIETSEIKKSAFRKWFFVTIILMAFLSAIIMLLRPGLQNTEKNAENKPLTLPDSITKMYNYERNGLSYRLTFLEFGSTNCVPCKQMERVMDEISAKYNGVVQTKFYNVSQKPNKPMATYFNIGLIPTQVLLDQSGQEFFRHVGFFSTDSLSLVIDKQLKNKQ